MSRRGLRSFIVICGGFLVLGGVIRVLPRERTLAYYVRMPGVRELPRELINPAFCFVTKRNLPEKVEDLKGIFSGGGDPAIFIGFRTDAAGVEYVRTVFGGSGVRQTIFGVNGIPVPSPSVASIFISIIWAWQDKTGVRIVDQRLIESGCRLERVADPTDPNAPIGYQVFVDDKNAKVYVFAHLYLWGEEAEEEAGSHRE